MSNSLFKSILVAGVLLAALPAMASTNYAPTGAMGQQDWSGLYAGIHTGAVWGDFSGHSATKVGPRGNDTGLLVGGQVGYNWQWEKIVAGAEADLSSSPAKGNDGVGAMKELWSSTFRGRAGYTFGKLLPYGTVGLGLTNTDSAVGTASVNNTHVGYALGAGADYALLKDLSARVEYLHVDVPEESDTVGGRAFNGGAGNNFFHIGANYRF